MHLDIYSFSALQLPSFIVLKSLICIQVRFAYFSFRLFTVYCLNLSYIFLSQSCKLILSVSYEFQKFQFFPI